MQPLAVPLVSFAFLVASVVVGAAGKDRLALWPVLRDAAAALRVLAVSVVLLAAAALAVLTYNTRAQFHQAQAQMTRFAGDVVALDVSLRAAGEAGGPLRMLLFRYVEGLSRQLYARPALPADPDTPEALHAALERAIAALPPQPGPAALAPGRFENLTRAAFDLQATVPPAGVKLCRPIIVGWMMVGLGLMALLAGRRAGAAIALVGLAAMLALGIYFLEEMAHPFLGAIVVPPSVLEDAMHTISD